MFRASQHPSSGALKTVTATSGIGHNTGTATSFLRGLIRRTDFAVTTSNYALCTPTITNCLQKDAHYSRMLQHKNINPVLVVLVLYVTRLNT